MKTITLITAIGLLVAGGAGAGTLTTTNAPAATMHTLEDLYRLLSGTVADTKIGLNNTNAPASTMHTIEQVYQLALTANGTNSAGCPVTLLRTGQIISYATGDDGYYQKGAVWPSTIFTVGTGPTADCVTDNRTGLMWVRNPSSTRRNWADALTYCETLNEPGGSTNRLLGTYTDWRMPNIRELHDLFDFGHDIITGNASNGLNTLLPPSHPFVGEGVTYIPDPVVHDGNWPPSFWSSTSDQWSGTPTRAYTVNMVESGVGTDDKVSATNVIVWAVRGGN